MAYIFDLVDTWNDGATTFTAVKMNVTDTASNAASLLMDLQVGASSKFSVAKNGTSTFGSSSVGLQANLTDIEFVAKASAVGAMHAGIYGIYMNSTLALSWASSSTNAKATVDTYLTRRGAANLRLGAADAAAPVAQTLSVQSITGTNASAAAYPFKITGAQGTGNAAGGSIIFQVAPAGLTGAAQNAPQDMLTIVAPSAGQSGASLSLRNDGNGPFLYSSFGGGISIGSSFGPAALYVSGTSVGIGGYDVYLHRDAAATLALRNGTAAQGFNIYKSYTGVSDYSRLAIYASGGGNFVISPEIAGSGVGGTLYILQPTAQAITFQTNNTDRWTISGSGGHLLAGADNLYDIGASGATRPRNVYIGGSIVVGDGGRISRQSGFGGIVFQSNNSVELGPGTGGTFATGANSAIRIVQPLTVATLPTPSTGMMARVTDALMPTMGTTVAGGGAAQALVWYNGANWTVIGV